MRFAGLQRSAHQGRPTGAGHGRAACSGAVVVGGWGGAAAPASRATPTTPNAPAASQGRAGIASAALYSITSSSTGRLALGSSTLGSRPPRRIELPS